MKTYNDFLEIEDTPSAKLEFIKSAIKEHQGSDLYRNAVIAQEYFEKRNVTIRNYEKFLYTIEGRAIKDDFSANYKLVSGFFHRFVVQEKTYLLGNGVTWKNKSTGDKLGTDEQPFDTALQDLAEYALVQSVSFGFFNKDHVDVFPVTNFVPLYDEENGALMAGIRFWQVTPEKPMRATLYEIDGYTDYIWNEKDREGKTYDSNGRMLQDKRKYLEVVGTSEVDGTEILDGENYPTFPIVPMCGNKAKQSELEGLREQIDCYDLVRSGFANNVDEGSIVYWLIQNAGGMDDYDIKKFLDRIKTVHAFSADEEGATAEPKTVDYPYTAREALLTRLEKDLYKDAMALDVEQIASGAVTATQIQASYEPLNEKADGLEYRVIEFIQGILAIAGIKDEKPSFTRSMITNTNEIISNVLQASSYLGEEYTTTKILTLLGDGDKAEEVLKALDEESMTRMSLLNQDQEEPETAETEENEENV